MGAALLAIDPFTMGVKPSSLSQSWRSQPPELSLNQSYWKVVTYDGIESGFEQKWWLLNASCLGGNSMTEILKPEIVFGPFLGYVGFPLLKHHHLGDSQPEGFTVVRCLHLHELNMLLPALSWSHGENLWNHGAMFHHFPELKRTGCYTVVITWTVWFWGGTFWEEGSRQFCWLPKS